MAAHATTAEQTFDQLARELASGVEVDAEVVAGTLERAGRSWSDLRAACDRAARPDQTAHPEPVGE